MKRLILGTAGHVDHGKTALIKALTGFDCDTHKEEKTRGITIHLGFSHLELPSGASFGIVDVPGHRDFIHTMVAGAMGIDLCVLVVAADSGVMPQTREHLQIMNVLGIRAGIVALNKIDLVDAEIAELAEDEIRELTAGTFLEGCPIVRVSAVTGAGLDELKALIESSAAALPERPASRIFRLFPDRIFSVPGFGTVVTGSVLGGSLQRDDTAFLLPAGKKLRVRRLERHGVEVETVSVGDRASLNLVGIERDEFARGMVLCDRELRATQLIDVKLRLFPGVRPFSLWSHAIFHLGTFECQARIHLLDCDQLQAGTSALAQIHLEHSCILQAGDRFVLRSTSTDLTLGGGEVVDPAPLHHRRRRESVVKTLDAIAEGQHGGLVAAEIRKHRFPVDSVALASLLNLTEEDVLAVAGSLPEDIQALATPQRPSFLATTARSVLVGRIVNQLKRHHYQNPLSAKGKTLEELQGTLGDGQQTISEPALKALLAELEAEQILKSIGNSYLLFGHESQVTPERQRQITFVSSFLARAGLSTPSMEDLRLQAPRNGIKERDLELVLRYLVENGKAYHKDGEYLHGEVVDRCRDTLVKALATSAKGLTVAEFRDLVNGNRKICLLLCNLFDGEGTTRREGDYRVLTEKGRQRAAALK